MRISEIVQILGARQYGSDLDFEVKGFIYDSRKILYPEHQVFLALDSGHRNGHQFIPQAWSLGVRAFLVSEPIAAGHYPGAVFLQVACVLTAFQQLAAVHRQKFSFPIIGITGSNGKTIVKEWLFQLLNASFRIVRSPKSFNSQLGVPLSLWNINPTHNLGLFEAGISKPGEMETLQRMIRPEIGILTNIGAAHGEGFEDVMQKTLEKLQLFRETDTLIYCADDPAIENALKRLQDEDARAAVAVKGDGDARAAVKNDVQKETDVAVPGPRKRRYFSWSRTDRASRLWITATENTGSGTRIWGLFEARKIHIEIPFRDAASIENAIHCWCLMLLLDRDDALITEQMRSLQAVAMRLQLVQGEHRCTLINDSYNSDLTSLQIALDVLAQQGQHPVKTLILSDLLQMDKPAEALYAEVADWINARGVHRMIGIGPAISAQKAAFRKHKHIRSQFFASTEAFLKALPGLRFENEAILLKGARPFHFEKIEKRLEQKIHRTVLEINLSALEHNFKVYRNLLPPQVKIMVMVKAYSYGSGSHEIANRLQQSGADYLGVAYTDEGIALRKSGITMPILVMSPENTAFDRMIAWDLEPELFNIHSIETFAGVVRGLDRSAYPVHLKLDTGMHRLGFMETDVDSLKQAIGKHPELKFTSIFSHLAGSDNPDLDAFSKEQIARFDRMTTALRKVLPQPPLLHILNSSGIVRHPEACYDMVRLGLGLYGVDATGAIQQRLQTTGTLKTTIAQIRQVRAGETVGYNRSGLLSRDSRIAIVSIGYADGYFRDFGNGNGYMLLRGKQAPVIGTVCMDMCMLDITDIPESEEGDEVIVFGEALPVSVLAKQANTIPYEIMTSVSQRVNRIYINE